MADDTLATLLAFFERHQQPLMVRIDRNTELLAQVSEGLRRVMDTQTAEPTRARIITEITDAMRELIDDHDKGCNRRSEDIDIKDKERASGLVESAMKRIDAVGNVAAQASESAEKMAAEFKDAKRWAMILAAVGTRAWGWMMWAFKHFPGQ